jgi:hypothetical protein
VSYRGQTVFARVNVPVLNVRYDEPGNGTCGPSYRDWFKHNAFPWKVTPPPPPGGPTVEPAAVDVTTAPITYCEVLDGPSDGNYWNGVAIERLADRITLTSQFTAGWYVYSQKMTFTADGQFLPRFGFTAIDDDCVNRHHTHHAYYRFDVDLDGFANDSIQRWLDLSTAAIPLRAFWSTLTVEGAVGLSPQGTDRYRVIDNVTRRSLTLEPGEESRLRDDYSGPHVWFLRYKRTEKDDGGRLAGNNEPASTRVNIDRFVNGESIERKDVVLWYRVTHRHDHGRECHYVGPTLKVFQP